MTKHRHRWNYSYVRGRADVFPYPFPVWIAQRVCKCKEREILAPTKENFNSGEAIWQKELPGYLLNRNKEMLK
jgi:hypothetical protein